MATETQLAGNWGATTEKIAKTKQLLQNNKMKEKQKQYERKLKQKEFELQKSEEMRENERNQSEKLRMKIVECNRTLKENKKKTDMLFLQKAREFRTKRNQIFKQKFRNHKNLIVKKQEDDNTIQNIKVSAELISKGWVSEAIPVIQKKKSFISRIFSVFFK